MWRAISLFSGAGGDTCGLEAAGVEVVAFVEWEQDMIDTHLANFPRSVLLGRDIAQVTEADLAPYIGTIDILFGSPPCQGVSHAGKKDPADPRNGLYREFVRVARILRPRWVLGENVRNLVSMKTRDGASLLDVMYRAFEEEHEGQPGYRMVPAMLLRADAFGVPQKRERCFFLGHLPRAALPPPADLGAALRDRILALGAALPRRTLRSVLEHSLDQALALTPDQAARVPRWHDYAAPTGPPAPTGTPPLNLRRCQETDRLSFGRRASPDHSELVDPDGLSKTLICTYNRMPRMFVPVRVSAAAAAGEASLRPISSAAYARPFTVREAQQIQGFPADYRILGTRTSALKQIGNAVPPPMVTAIVRAIRAAEEAATDELVEAIAALTV